MPYDETKLNGKDRENLLRRRAIRAKMQTQSPAEIVKNMTPAQIEAAKKLQNPTGNFAGGGDFMSLVSQYQQQNKCSKLDAMLYVIKTNPDSHRRCLEAANPGKTIR